MSLFVFTLLRSALLVNIKILNFLIFLAALPTELSGKLLRPQKPSSARKKRLGVGHLTLRVSILRKRLKLSLHKFVLALYIVIFTNGSVDPKIPGKSHLGDLGNRLSIYVIF